MTDQEEKKAVKPKKVLSVEEHNSQINAKVRDLMEKIVELKSELKEVSPVKQATLAECNAMKKPDFRPQAHAVKLKHPEVVRSTSNPLDV